jgi:hypothetical protein
MDISAALTNDEIATLSDAERVCEDTARQLGEAGMQEDTGLAVFAESLRVKNTLDAFEEEGVCSELREEVGC